MNRRLLTILCLLLLGASPGRSFAQTVPGPFADVSAGGWEFAAAQTLQKAGVAFPYSMETGTYSGRRGVTRYAFAVVTARLLETLNSPTGSDVEKKLTQTPPALNALIALTGGFQTELSKLGQDVPAAQVKLEAMQAQVRRAVWDGKIALDPALASSPFADVRTDQLPYEQVDTLQKAGIVIGDPDGTGGRVSMTWLQFGISIARLMTRLTGTINFPGIAPADMSSLRADFQKRLISGPGALDALKSLVTEFALELQLLGQDVPAYKARLNEVAQARLPENFWAYQAIDTLTKAGVIVGGPDDYPRGTYSGSARGLWPTRAKIAHALAFALAALPSSGFLQERLRQSPDALASLERLTNDFAPELKRLGQDVPAAKARLAVLGRKPFPDLPPKHWAYGAVETLRQECIMEGFPQGTFTVL